MKIALLVFVFCVGGLVGWLTSLDRSSVADLILDEEPCLVQAVGTAGTEEGLDQYVENVQSQVTEDVTVQVARGDGYVAVVAIKCGANAMDH